MRNETVTFDPILPAIEREFKFTSGDFERVRVLIYRHAGISLTPVKQDMVYSRLARRLRALGYPSFEKYLDRVETGDEEEKQAFVNALTTNLTSFFREPYHFDILRERLRAIGRQRQIRIWCAAASTGEEAYSLAMTACEAYDSLKPPVRIVATDIDTSVLEIGRKGVYTRDSAQRLSPERLRRFAYQGGGAKTDEVRMRKELVDMVQFSRVNLLEQTLPLTGPFDAIFCRNVMIYFDKATQRNILARLLPLLRDDGLLFAGHSENFLHATDLFRSLGRTVYEPAGKKG